MKRLLLLTMLLCGPLWAAEVTVSQTGNNGTVTFVNSGDYAQFRNQDSAFSATFDVVITGSPASVSIPFQGCGKSGNCHGAASSYTSTASSPVGVTFDAAYPMWKITPSWTGGTNVTITINISASTANSHTGTGGAAAFTPPVTATQSANGATLERFTRFTDTSPTGFFTEDTTHAGSDVFSVDVSGNVVANNVTVNGTCTGCGGGFTPPSGWTVSSALLTNTVTNNVTSGTGALYSNTWNPTITGGADAKLAVSTDNSTGAAQAGSTWSNIYNVGVFNLTSGHLTHGLEDVQRLTMTSTPGTTTDLFASGYYTLGATNLNGTATAAAIMSLSFDTTVSGTGSIPLMEGLSVGAPPNPSGGVTYTTTAGVNVADYVAGSGSNICSVCVGGTPTSIKAPVFIATPGATPTAMVYVQGTGQSGGGNSLFAAGYATARVFQLNGGSGAPTGCTFTSGGGTSPSCAFAGGSTDGGGIIKATTGTGSPSSSGDITITFAAMPGTTVPVCTYTLSVAGVGQWDARATVMDKSPSTSTEVFHWDNNGTNLGTSTEFWINYHCIAKT